MTVARPSMPPALPLLGELPRLLLLLLLLCLPAVWGEWGPGGPGAWRPGKPLGWVGDPSRSPRHAQGPGTWQVGSVARGLGSYRPVPLRLSPLTSIWGSCCVGPQLTWL